MKNYVTDQALTAQTVETPCTPRSGFSYIRFGFLFAVDVTEMAKLGPEQDPILNQDAVEEHGLPADRGLHACNRIGVFRHQHFPKGVLNKLSTGNTQRRSPLAQEVLTPPLGGTRLRVVGAARPLRTGHIRVSLHSRYSPSDGFKSQEKLVH